MASYDEYLSALPKVTYQGRSSGMQRDAAARILHGTGVDPEHIGSLTAIHAGADLPMQHAAVYNHEDGSLRIRGDLYKASGLSSGFIAAKQHTLAHETGHRLSHLANPVQFANFLHHPIGRGILEADAENYADQAVPGFRSGYDKVTKEGSAPFNADAYTDRRGVRFGEVGRRLR